MRDRRKHLHVPVSGALTAERDGHAFTMAVVEMSLGGARVLPLADLLVGDRMDLKVLTLGDETFDLGVIAEVIEIAADSTTVAFVEMDAVGKSNTQVAFSAAVAPVLTERKNQTVSMRFAWAFRDAAQLAAVCKTLLFHADLSDAWSAAGPSDHARQYLARGGGDLQPGQLAMLRTVWTLWCGSLDISAQLVHLPEASKASLLALQKAMTRGPSGIDAWLNVEG